MRWKEFRRNVNTCSGKVNTHSGKTRKVFTLNQNERSRSIRTGVHLEPEWVFILGQNMHYSHIQSSCHSDMIRESLFSSFVCDAVH